ncbi:Peptidyl-prolyl cis-trans isomerase ESS1 [Durusdinium trenchii]|uniref:Peptidyl-prolyl cis-trans isomerase ESS1 n=1 Tax=Durusdinium trenchii TaxID=1381693 RepID=A0ABP0RGJ1_9DINO
MARQLGELVWQHDVPPPDFSVINDEMGTPLVRAELSLFRREDGTLRELRLRGPRRPTVPEARKDGSELRRSAFHGATVEALKARAFELEDLQWSAVELVGEDVAESAERRLPEFTTATQAEKFKEQEKSVSSLREWIYAKTEEQRENFQPSGPNWSLAGQAMAVPRLPGVWYVHERQQEGGRPLPWLFFNASTGKYYRRVHGTTGSWVQAGTPHQPVTHPITMQSSVLCNPAEGGRKDDLAVALLDLQRTASTLKQPVPFIDKPASLFVLVDGLRNTAAASEFCAKRFHSQILPRLSCRSDPLEDHELVAIMRDSIESLDHALLDSAARFSGCGICVALLMGRRLVVGTLGACRAVLSQKSRSGTWTGRPLAPEQVAHQSSLRRWHHAYAPLNAVDLQSGALRPGCSLHAASATAEQLAQFPEEERLLQRVERAAHPFAALGLTVQQLQGGVAQRARAECEEQLQVLKERFPERVTAALARVQEASEEIESFLRMDTYVTQILAELYYLVDEEGGIPAPKRAAAHLGVEPGCGEAAAQAGIDRRFRALMTQLAQVSGWVVQKERGFRILAELADTVQRPQAAVWVPLLGQNSARRLQEGLGSYSYLGEEDLELQDLDPEDLGAMQPGTQDYEDFMRLSIKAFGDRRRTLRGRRKGAGLSRPQATEATREIMGGIQRGSKEEQ